jgi:hypothetical protein
MKNINRFKKYQIFNLQSLILNIFFITIFFGLTIFFLKTNNIVIAADQMKTTEYVVYSSNTQISSQVDAAFSVYIGDDVTGVVNPVKSIFYTVTGVYTGGGTLAFSLNSDASTTQTFVLPAVANPTYFELIYVDPANKINPQTAGTFSYTLNIVPSAVTISAVGVKGTVTHEYTPPACAGYPPTGELISNVYENEGTADGMALNSLLWIGSLGGPASDVGRVRFQFAASDNPTGPWTFIGGSTCASGDWFEPGEPDLPIEFGCYADYNNKKYFKYKIQLCADDCVVGGDYTPTVDEVVVNWSP